MINTEPEKIIAWNNLSLTVPTGWEVDSLDISHVLIGEDGSPRIEIKWVESPRQFTLERFLKKFITQAQRQLDIIIHEQQTPNDFSHPINSFEFFFFSWRGHGAKGIGTLIFCRQCKRLSLIRFFKTNHLDELSKKILLSFSDHPIQNKTHWSVFGMNIEAPSTFVLEDYSFKPGAFSLELKYRKTQLKFYSWGPASFLLSQTDLSGFAVQRLPWLSGFARTGVCPKGSYLEWTFKQNRLKNAQLIPFFKHFSSFSLFRICHDTEKNRILGVLATSPLQFEHALLKGSILGDI